MRNKKNLKNIDKSDLQNYPDARIKDNTGAGDGTPVSELVYGDIHENLAKLLRLYDIKYNNLPDNETNGYQIVQGLIALASKNDYILDATTVNNSIRVLLKVSKVLPGEFFIARVNFNQSSSINSVVGRLDSKSKPLLYHSSFGPGDYIIMHYDGARFQITKLIDGRNLDSSVAALDFLKAATTTATIAGTSNSAAVTPLAFLNAFVALVNGSNSDTYEANASRNGLYPREHFSIVQNLGQDKVRNTGFITGIDINAGPVVQNYSVGGDATQGRRISASNGGVFEVTMANAMQGTNYFVRLYVESLSSYMGTDNDFRSIVFKPVTNTKFQFFLEERAAVSQSLKVHFEAVQI